MISKSKSVKKAQSPQSPAGQPMSESWAKCYQNPSADLLAKAHEFARYLQAEREGGHDFFNREFLSPNRPRSVMRDRVTGQPRDVIMLGSNSYLGLTADPRVIEASVAAARKYGFGMGSVSLYAGTSDLHVELEHRLAKWYRCESAVIFPSGYAANVGTISALLRPGDVVVNDLFNHASINDGCRLSGARTYTYGHRNMRNLSRVLKTVTAEGASTLVITDGVFSMEGDVAPLDEIVPLVRQYGARLMLDDAHALGVIGPNGRGTAELCGVEGQVDITMGTLSKCLGGIGGCVAGCADLIDYLKFFGRSYFFSASVPAPIVAGALTVLDIIEQEPEHRESLWRCTRYMVESLKAMGYDITNTQSAIIPVVIGDENSLQAMLGELLEAGIFMNFVSFPAVPKTRCRLRMSMMAGHQQSDLDYVLETMRKLGKKYGVI